MKKNIYGMPSEKYLEVVKCGIQETYPGMSDFVIVGYLVDCGVEYGK